MVEYNWAFVNLSVVTIGSNHPEILCVPMDAQEGHRRHDYQGWIFTLTPSL